MEHLSYFFDVMIHLDRYLVAFVADYGQWSYLAVMAVIFCETGLIVTPFLPGDSLLFALGSLAAQPSEPLNALFLFFLLVAASFIGNQVNYYVGRWIGPRVLSEKGSRWINQANLRRAHAFYEKHGGKTIIFARFMPIIRTFVPFVAGVSTMQWRQFTVYNVVSAIIWIGCLLGAGYFFGSLPWIKDHFNWVIYGIIIVSLMPSVFAVLFQKRTT